MFDQAQSPVIRHIQKSVFYKIISNPNHFLYSRVLHQWVDGKDDYILLRSPRQGVMSVIINQLSPRHENDLWERGE